MKRSEMTCETCIFSHKGKKQRIYCRNQPPSESVTAFRTVHKTWWCGEGRWLNQLWTPGSDLWRFLDWGDWEDE